LEKSGSRYAPPQGAIGKSIFNSIVEKKEVTEPVTVNKKAPFIPSLKVGGLGMSTLIKENGKT